MAYFANQTKNIYDGLACIFCVVPYRTVMDVRTKFILSMFILAGAVGAVSVFVYISATSDPFADGGQEIPLRPTSIEDGGTGGVDPLFPIGGGENNETPERKPVGTISLETPETPEYEAEKDPGSRSNRARYRVRMHAPWSQLQHGTFYPAGAHLSPMVAWAHRLKNTVFATGTLASDGMEIMAETGATKTLAGELQELGKEGRLHNYNIGKRIDAPGEDSVIIVLSNTAPFASVVSMIAPSPDWFIAAHNVRLFENNQWVKKSSVPAVLYDSGTDSGTTFTAKDADTAPPEPIHRFAKAPVVPIATFDFIRIED